MALLEKAAIDNGFDLELAPVENWLAYTSTSAPLKVWLTRGTDGVAYAGLSRLDVARALERDSEPSAVTAPPGAMAVRSAVTPTELHRLLRRAWQLARSLPDEPLVAFQKQTAALPRSTEAERLVIQRVGQGIYRERLMEYWEGRCAITGLAVPSLLRASHIKPWADCATDAERLDVFNGLLLAPQLDAAFDCGFITVGDDGLVLVSDQLDIATRGLLGLSEVLRVPRLTDQHRGYLPWHRERVFRVAAR